MTSAPYNFTHALCRAPAASAVHGIRADGGPDPDFAGLAAEHAAYVATLRDLGLTVDVLPPLDDFPDALFTEDVALTFPEGAILLRPGAPSRAGEVAHIRAALAVASSAAARNDRPRLRRRRRRAAPRRPGDHRPVRPHRSRRRRPNWPRCSANSDYRAEIAETPPGVLHFKTGCGLIDENTILAVPELASCPQFAGLEVVLTPLGENPAANILRVRNTVLVGDRWLATRAMLTARGIDCRPLPTDQIARIDAGLSCMSLRW